MADEKKLTRADKTALDRIRAGGEPIAVAELRFASTNGIELPGSGTTSRVSKITAGIPAGGGKFAVEYWPWIRHHCVAFVEAGKEPVMFLVHETWASWAPA